MDVDVAERAFKKVDAAKSCALLLEKEERFTAIWLPSFSIENGQDGRHLSSVDQNIDVIGDPTLEILQIDRDSGHSLEHENFNPARAERPDRRRGSVQGKAGFRP